MTIAADGYANIEHYLNWLADPHALTVTNTPVAVDLWQYTGGFTNASPVYSVNNASNGVVTLNADGHTAQFTPGPEFFRAGQFSIQRRCFRWQRLYQHGGGCSSCPKARRRPSRPI